MSKRVIELIRVSTEGQAAANRASIPAQRAANRRTAEFYGLEIYRSIEISDVSGAAVLHAPEIREMIELMRSPEIHGVVAKEFSRLMRPENFDDYALLQHFADTKTILYLPEGPIDLGSKMGRLMGGVRALFAGVEREEIRERVWGAKEAKRKRGENPQSKITLPFGVGYNQDLGWFYTPSAEKVREAFRLLLAGNVSYNDIGELTGISPSAVRIILRNPIYTGWRVIDQKRDTSPSASKFKRDGRQGDRPKIRRAPDEIIRVKVIDVGLVSQTEFEQVQQIMDLKKKLHWRTNPEHVSPYAYHGHLSCAECGELVYTYSNARGGRYYVCKAKQYPRSTEHKCATTYMRREFLEPQLDLLFSARLTDPVLLRELVREHERRMEDPVSVAALTRVEKEIANLAAKRERVLSAFFDGVIAGPERDSHLAGIEAELKVNQGLVAQHTPVEHATTEVLDSICWTFHDWEFLNVADKRRILASTAAEIRVANSSIHGLYINVPESRHNEISRGDKDSSPPPA
jgi:DNA invertase Pin-like site-specific DNA recombinase